MERIRALDGENIIVVTNNIVLTAAVVDANRAACRELMQQMTGPIALVIDYRDIQTSFADIMQILRGNQAGKRADMNARMFTIFVGQDKFVQMYRDAMSQPQFGGVQVPCFTGMDDALKAARVYLANESQEESA
jgi:hypothetical protein